MCFLSFSKEQSTWGRQLPKMPPLKAFGFSLETKDVWRQWARGPQGPYPLPWETLFSFCNSQLKRLSLVPVSLARTGGPVMSVSPVVARRAHRPLAWLDVPNALACVIERADPRPLLVTVLPPESPVMLYAHSN